MSDSDKPQAGASSSAPTGSAIAGYAVRCPNHGGMWRVRTSAKRRAIDGREFYRGNCSICGWRTVRMLPPNAAPSATPNEGGQHGS